MKTYHVLVVAILFPMTLGQLQGLTARRPIGFPANDDQIPDSVGITVENEKGATTPRTETPTEPPIRFAITAPPPEIKTTTSTTTIMMIITRPRHLPPSTDATVGAPIFSPRTQFPPSTPPESRPPVATTHYVSRTVTVSQRVTVNTPVSDSDGSNTKRTSTNSTTAPSSLSTSSRNENKQFTNRSANSTGTVSTTAIILNKENSSKHPATKKVEPFDSIENTRTLPIPPSSQITAVTPPISELTTYKNSNSTASGVHVTVSGLCGYPPYSNRMACLTQDYSSDTLSDCENEWGRILFGLFVGLAGVAIIIVNVLIPAVFAKNSDMRSHYDYIKVSLAIANGLTGFLMTCSVLPNMMWIRNLTEQEVVMYSRHDVNSATAISVGSLVTVSTHGSLLHLCFLSIERFMTIKWTFWRISRRTRSIVTSLVVLWIISFLFAFVPAIFPDHFEYQFQPALLIHMVTVKANDGASEVGNQDVVYNALVLALPYTIMVIFCILTGIASYQKLRSTAQYFGQEHASSSRTKRSQPTTTNDPGSSAPQNKTVNTRPEIAVFITILIMISAFTLTTLPFSIVTGLFVNGALNCNNYTIPYVTTFYFGLLNSLMNGFIYSVRDARFRSAVKRLFRIAN